MAGNFQLTRDIPVYVSACRQKIWHYGNILRAELYTVIDPTPNIGLSKFKKCGNNRFIVAATVTLNPGCEFSHLLISSLFAASMSN